jgi:hypothetical protein
VAQQPPEELPGARRAQPASPAEELARWNQQIASAQKTLQLQIDAAKDEIAAAKEQLAVEEGRAAAIREQLRPLQGALDIRAQMVEWEQRAAAAKHAFASDELRAAALRKELSAIEESIDLQSFGFYRPRYGFESSDELATIREEQKALIKLGRATHCDKKWVVDGDARAGQKMIDEQAKLEWRKTRAMLEANAQ